MSPFGRPPLPPKWVTYFVNGPKSRKDRQDRQDRRLVILGDLDDLGDLCSILHFFTSMIFPLLNFNIFMKIKAIYSKKIQN